MVSNSRDVHEHVENRKSQKTRKAPATISSGSDNVKSKISHHTRSSSWFLCHYEEIQRWAGDNEYIVNFHRPPLGCLKKCLRSIFKIHNETLNIWTHLLGCFIFVAFATWMFISEPLQFYISQTGISRYPNALDGMQKYMFYTYFITAVMCMTFSWVFHAFKCHSEHAYRLLVKLDYLGILVLMFGSNIPLTYYAFYCNRNIFIFFSILIIFICLICAFMTCIDEFSTARYRLFRAIFFLLVGSFIVIPMGTLVVMYGWNYLIHAFAMKKLILTGILYVSGVIIYAMRIPERFKPGIFDIFFNSHQIFHVNVVIGAVVHIFCILDSIIFRTTDIGLCPNP